MQKRKEADYEVYTVSLPDLVRERISGLKTGKKAEEIVRLLLIQTYGDRAKIKKARDGADIRVEFDDGNSFGVEVKGTSDTKIAWGKLKVSSQQSHDALKSGEVVMFRVVDVDGENPRIYVLEHGRDFYMQDEPRWSVKPAEPTDRQRYPFVGEPYRYDDPYEPVAQDDWEILK